jgi:membrane-associated protein
VTHLALIAGITQWLSPEYIISQMGSSALWIVAFIIFAECGLLIGFFLPGDSLLFITGLSVATGLIPQPLWFVCLLLAVAAFLGNLCGYWIGAKAGPALFNKPESKFFKQEYVDKTHAFFERYGAPAIILGRFVPIVRTFITAIAGVGRMDFRKYATYSLIGAVLWAVGVTLLGYFLGQIDWVKSHIDLVLILVVVISCIPLVIEYLRHRNDASLEA